MTSDQGNAEIVLVYASSALVIAARQTLRRRRLQKIEWKAPRGSELTVHVAHVEGQRPNVRASDRRAEDVRIEDILASIRSRPSRTGYSVLRGSPRVDKRHLILLRSLLIGHRAIIWNKVLCNLIVCRLNLLACHSSNLLQQIQLNLIIRP